MKRRACCLAALVLVAAPTLPAQTTNTAPAAVTAPPLFPKAVPAAQVITQSEAALAEYPLPGTTAPDSTADEVRQAMLEKHGEMKLFADTTSTSLAQNPSLDYIRSRTRYGEDLATQPAAWTKSLTDRTTTLGKKLDQIAADQSTWQDTLGALQAQPPAPPELVQRAKEVLARLATVKNAQTAQQNELLQLENQVTDEASLVNTALGRLSTARSQAVSQLFETNAPPVWSGEAMPAVDESAKQGWSKQWNQLTRYAESQQAKFVLHALILLVLVGCFYWLRHFARSIARNEAGVRPVEGLFETPAAAGVLIAIIAGWPLYYPVAPHLLFAIFGAIALVPTVILLRRVIERRMFPILYALVTFFLLENIRSVASLSPEAERTFLLAELVGAFSFLGWLILSLRREPSKQISPQLRAAGWAAFVVLVIGWLAEVMGYTQLANLICVGVQRSATMGLALYAGVRILDALLFVLTRLRPLSQLSMMNEHRTAVLMHLQRVLGWAATAWWAVLTIELTPSTSTLSEHLFGSPVAHTGGWLGHYKGDGSYASNFVGKLIVAVLVVWAMFLLSRLTRFVLKTEFYPRLRLSAGIPYAISMTIHYAMLTIAFIGATAVLGIDMTKFTILVSALGVGVGFGLQNIINNFVSGLILLFERPVKIGDSVQTGDAAGVVERIGIRASVLRTSGGTEVIVPNGSLISNNVTNWTLSSEERIILIPLNVPRGPDIAHLIDLLKKAAAAHPMVLRQPPPMVQAQTLGVNLGLELRAWTRSAEDGGSVRSDLVLAINAALTKENITLA